MFGIQMLDDDDRGANSSRRKMLEQLSYGCQPAGRSADADNGKRRAGSGGGSFLGVLGDFGA
jgi:hypothetical protein